MATRESFAATWADEESARRSVGNRLLNGGTAIGFGIFVFAFAGAPVGVGLWNALWVVMVLAALVAVLWRTLRMGVIADADGVLIKNLDATPETSNGTTSARSRPNTLSIAS